MDRAQSRSTVYRIAWLYLTGSILCVAATDCTVFAQAQPPTVSPEVLPDRRVTFRLRAPNAKTVTLNLEGTRSRPMAKAENGVWSVTTDPLEPDFYGYSF